MKILTFSSLFPNAAQPFHGVFVENRLRHLVAGGRLQAQVVAPVPWFPFAGDLFGSYGDFAKAPGREERFGLQVEHPRFVSIPKVGMNWAPSLLYRGAVAALERVRQGGFDFDLIDAHYFYPDGVAAVMLGRRFKRPVTVTARGTDINLIPRYARPRRMILQAAAQAAGIISVCQALKDEMVAMGIAADKIRVLRNGVDLEHFQPLDPLEAKQRLGLSGSVILSAGHLIARKGHDFVVRALAQVPEATLLIVGKGPEEGALKALVQQLDLGARVRFIGGVAHQEMANYYSAADLLVLASDREGWPNVLLESMACGTPAVASRVWGNPEVIAAPAAGLLFERRDPTLIADATKRLLAQLPDRAETRRYAEGFSWDDTSRGQLALFQDILQREAEPARPALALGNG